MALETGRPKDIKMQDEDERITVTLSRTEVKIAYLVGTTRRNISLAHKRNSRRDFTPSGVTNDVEAVGAEMAVAKTLNLYPDWAPVEGEVPTFDLKWKGFQIDVKSTVYSHGNLLVPNPRPDVIYVLVRGTIPTYTIVGAISGVAVKQQGHFGDHVYLPCWVVDSRELKPIRWFKE